MVMRECRQSLQQLLTILGVVLCSLLVCLHVSILITNIHNNIHKTVKELYVLRRSRTKPVRADCFIHEVEPTESAWGTDCHQSRTLIVWQAVQTLPQAILVSQDYGFSLFCPKKLLWSNSGWNLLNYKLKNETVQNCKWTCLCVNYWPMSFIHKVLLQVQTFLIAIVFQYSLLQKLFFFWQAGEKELNILLEISHGMYSSWMTAKEDMPSTVAVTITVGMKQKHALRIWSHQEFF